MHALPFLAAVVLAQLDVRERMPEQLRRVIESRAAETSEIEWTLTYHRGRDAGLVERHVTRTAGDTTWDVNDGDANGEHITRFDAAKLEELGPNPTEEELAKAAGPAQETAGPRHSLLYDGRAWYLEHQRKRVPLSGSATPDVGGPMAYHRPLEFVSAGLGPWWNEAHPAVLGLPQQSVRGFDSAEYTVTSHGDTDTIIAEYAGHTIEWELDKSHGGCPVYGR